MKRALIACSVLAIAACDQVRPSQDAPEARIDTSAIGESVEATAPAPADVTAMQVMPPEEGAPAVTAPAAGRRIYTPASGSAERTALMDALRAKVRGDLGGDVVFVVNNLKSDGNWAFAELEPQWRDGRKIDPASTPLYRGEPDWPFDGLHTEAIWRKVDGRWQVMHHSIGATDVWWVEHCNTVPRGVMTGC